MNEKYSLFYSNYHDNYLILNSSEKDSLIKLNCREDYQVSLFLKMSQSPRRILSIMLIIALF